MKNENVNFNYLRPIKAKELEQWYTDSFSCKEKLCVMEVQNATILPLKHFDSDDVSQGRGGVVDSVDGYIGLSGVEGRIFGRYEYDINSCDYIESEIVYGGYLTNHWGHFLIESVPRLWYALTHPAFKGDIVFFSDFGEECLLKDNFYIFFELLNLVERVRIINKPVRYKMVIIPELSYGRTDYYSDYYNMIFDTIIQNCKANSEQEDFPEKVFLSRSKFSKSKPEIGMDFLDSYFKKNGYAIIFPEDCSLEKLVKLMMHAKRI